MTLSGAGKTYTALYGVTRLAKEIADKLAIFIVCPYIHLVSQWEEDVEEWRSVPIIIAHSKSPDKNWKQSLLKAYKRFRKDGSPFVCITTNDTFSREDIQQYSELENRGKSGGQKRESIIGHSREKEPCTMNRIILCA